MDAYNLDVALSSKTQILPGSSAWFTIADDSCLSLYPTKYHLKTSHASYNFYKRFILGYTFEIRGNQHTMSSCCFRSLASGWMTIMGELLHEFETSFEPSTTEYQRHLSLTTALVSLLSTRPWFIRKRRNWQQLNYIAHLDITANTQPTQLWLSNKILVATKCC